MKKKYNRAMVVFVGLGNPGATFDKTYHNIGFMVVDELAKELGLSFTKNKCDALLAEGEYNGQKVVVAKPQTYMNLSGISLRKIKSKNKEACIIVICDDIDIKPGELRFREKGGPGTHNGLRNIVANIGEDFARLRVGIGEVKGDLADFVTSKISNMPFYSKVVKDAVELLKKKI